MENLYKILELKEFENSKQLTILLSSKKHPFFKAHFENNEILAGFLQIDIVLNVLKQKVKKIKRAKFLSIIYPNDELKYFIEQKDSSNFKVIIKNKEEKKVSEFSYEI
ncbi:hypothetical protein CRU87_06925 [Aliarcobacter trophiarum LMG 25534]|uniref:ApeI dehydratase-like domain-containing protein n=1 Tax=Aliarcobacter trophiarum LMG 25534 TaxID=1032241 RepID=A0AAD0VMM7_9BACT|nr:hypothetical protein [Aliarcobacter trophiarum]AXK49065.1 hypothetical protein ATR_1206 [Aliarcobacter trophiarum LMG 25534]RXI28241.1 hypothetical protein CRU89_02180 [Aliarcobacter trophiarum]RXJ90954.1 hypothetical protein CRU87_06925 [Aliarcobacter trophiarum LMG 25534]